ncbi:hypothetical protein ACFXPX_09260 [Kitasatospora sp. NPDC059146]|uniref:hypothetical protein n=1 Tax=unclassified Kitasatospora TaxID=2633591 RepID=UPI0036CEB757
MSNDEQTRERSAEQRNITAPTPADVRAKAEEAKEQEEAKEAREHEERNEAERGRASAPPAAGTRAP